MQRPLGLVSDFVVSALPEYLSQYPEALPRRVRDLVEGLKADDTDRVFGSDQHELARLDLKILEAGLVHKGLEAPNRLLELVNHFSGIELPGITYEDIVLINPIDDLRTFSCGEVRPTESLFYNEHRHIEERVGLVISDIQSLIKYQTPILTLEQIEHELKLVVESTKRLSRMPKGHFGQFRNYLGSHPVRKVKGASAAYSARMPTLELYCRGESLPEKYLDYLHEHWLYFPLRDRSLLKEAMDTIWTHRTLNVLALTEPSCGYGERASMIQSFFTDFRKAHMGAVNRQTPDVLAGKADGTGGETNVRAFLEERMR